MVLAPVKSTRYPDTPAFTGDVNVYFAQLEAHFSANNISSDALRLNILISQLPPALTGEVKDLITAPPPGLTYDLMKAEVLRRTTTSTQKKFHQLLHNEVLGDRRPSQLLRRMRELIDGNQADEALLKQLFFSRLPANTQAILAPMKEGTSVAQLAEAADNILETTTHSSMAAPVLNSGENALVPYREYKQFCRDMEHRLQLLTDKLDQLLLMQHHRARSPKRRSPSPRGRSTLCFYHERFGQGAYKCVQPCSFYSDQRSPSIRKENGQAGN